MLLPRETILYRLDYTTVAACSRGLSKGPPNAMANMPQSTFPVSCCTVPCKFVLTTLGVMEVACLLNTPGFHLQLSRRSPNETPRCGEFDCSHVSLGKLKGGLNITLGGPKTLIFWGPILIGPQNLTLPEPNGPEIDFRHLISRNGPGV